MAKDNVRNILLAIIFVLILVVIALFIGRFTYSYLGAQVDDLLEGEGEVTATGDTIIFSKGNDLSINASTDNFYTGSGNLTDTTNPQVRLIASSKTNNASSTYYVGFRINENTFTYSTTNNTAELILTIRDENGNIVQSSSDTLSYVTVNGVSGFDITNKTGVFNVVTDHLISTTSSTTGITHTWTFTLTFVNLSNDQSINENATLDMDVILQKDRIEQNMTLASYIKGLYTSQGANGLYYHTSSLANSAADNSYRYAGASEEVNNYVCFGSDASTCPSDNLYRIIGVFGNQVKLIKADYTTTTMTGSGGDYYGAYSASTSYYKGSMSTSNLASYYWNRSNGTSSTNTWSTSRLNRTNLNSSYLSYIGTTWSNKIATTTWYVGGHSTYNATPATFQDAESTGTTYSAKIGLMYANDYGFAASPSYWTTNMSSYSSARDNNWMYMGLYEWTVSRESGDSNGAWYVNDVVRVGGDGVGYDRRGVRPSFSLSSSVLYSEGDGTRENPIRLTPFMEFYVNGISFGVNENTTWEEFINSTNNKYNMYINESGNVVNSSGYEILLDGNTVS